MNLSRVIQDMTDNHCLINVTKAHWFPFWRFCSVRLINGRYVITNRPY